MLLCLDLSLKSTGYAIFTQEGKLLDKNKICPPKDYTNPEKILFIVNNLRTSFDKARIVVIEDVYLGITGVRNLVSLSRLAGAVIYYWMTLNMKDPIFLSATHARKVIGLKGNCQKAEVQIFILKKYKFVSPKLIYHYEAEIDRLQEEKDIITREKPITVLQKKDKKKRLGKVKYRFNKLSKEIEKETGYGEDICDSVLIGLAYSKELNGIWIRAYW